MFKTIKRHLALPAMLLTVAVFTACGGESTDNQSTDNNATVTDPPTDRHDNTPPVEDVEVEVPVENVNNNANNNSNNGNNSNNSGNDEEVEVEETPEPVKPTVKAYSALGGKVAAGDKFYIDLGFEKGTGFSHQHKVEGGLKFVGKQQIGKGDSGTMRLTFEAKSAGPATILVARVKQKLEGTKLSKKDWLKAKKYTLTVTG